MAYIKVDFLPGWFRFLRDKPKGRKTPWVQIILWLWAHYPSALFFMCPLESHADERNSRGSAYSNSGWTHLGLYDFGSVIACRVVMSWKWIIFKDKKNAMGKACMRWESSSSKFFLDSASASYSAVWGLQLTSFVWRAFPTVVVKNMSAVK